MKWYRTKASYGAAEIEEVEVTKETAQFITIKYDDWLGRPHEPHERRQAKRSGYENFFPDREQAKQWIIDRLDGKLNLLSAQINKIQDDLTKAKAL